MEAVVLELVKSGVPPAIAIVVVIATMRMNRTSGDELKSSEADDLRVEIGKVSRDVIDVRERLARVEGRLEK